MWWRLNKFIIGLLSFGFLLTNAVKAQDLYFSRNARTFETRHSSLVMKGLAHACLTIIKIPDGLPCNPANVPQAEKPSFGAEALLSNGYSSLNNVRNLLKGKLDQGTIDALFSEGKIIQIEANAEINFTSKFINARYTPLTVKGLSVVRNEANPDVELSTLEEKGFMFQSGHEVFKDFYMGAQVRFIDRKFIRQQFKLVELGTPEGKELIKPKKQTATYFEPGITWFLGNSWRPRIALFIENLGFVSKEYEEMKVPVDVQFGFGISPPVRWGEMELSLEYRGMSYEEDPMEKIHFGGLYHFGAMYLSGGLDANGISGGIYYGLDKTNAGVMYSTTRFMNEDKDFYTQTVYVQLGWQI